MKMMQIITPSSLQYKTYQIRRSRAVYYSFIFQAIMGFESRTNRGVHVEDVKLVLRGHVKDGYKVPSFEF